jgi:bifunctional non-homologous end joining protein LigD
MLKKYAEKRDFEKTPEPESFSAAPSKGPLRFCIQKHAARRLHYDLRLEVDGAFVSWAVPKGPSFDPANRHIAIHVEDHPLSYGSFEGQIPKGEYGGGEVIVWDEGVYTPDEPGLFWHDREEAQRLMREGLKSGKLSVTFDGKKMKGSFTLVRTKRDDDWLLIKHKDEFADPKRDEQLDPRSVISGRTVEDVKGGRTGETLSDRVSNTPGAVLADMPSNLTPMLLSEASKPFTNEDWLFELKLDGIRLLAYVKSGGVSLITRNGNDVTYKFPRLVSELAQLPDCVMDGEVVHFREDGLTTFGGLLERFQIQDRREIDRIDNQIKADFCIFDLIYFDQWDLRKCALKDRRSLLTQFGPTRPLIRVIDAFPEEGELLYEQATQMGFEGIVGKKLKSVYQDGRRSGDWVKVKTVHSDEFVIGGYAEGEGARSSTFGALLVGKPDEAGKLTFFGTVGSGYKDDELESLWKQLQPLKTKENPFSGEVVLKAGKPKWLEPKHWVEVKYGEITRDNRLRFPVFIRMRPDLDGGPPKQAKVKSKRSEPAPEAVKEQMNVSDDVVRQLDNRDDEVMLRVEGHEVKLSSLNKVLWPKTDDSPAFSKRDLVAYYARMHQRLIRHLRDRPISFVRLPEGLGGERFFQKHWDMKLPSYIETVPIYSSSKDTTKPYVLINNLPTLMWLAQMSAMEIHPWYSRICQDGGAEEAGTDTGSSDDALDHSTLHYPDFMVVDLDPMVRSGKEVDAHEPELNRPGWEMVVSVAGSVKELLEKVGLRGYPKTSGKAGLHIYIPLKRVYEYEVVREVCQTLGKLLEAQVPDKVTMEWVVKKRPEKVFFDHNQNVRGKTLSGAYTVRAVPGAPVSMPIEWKQVGQIYPAEFAMTNVPDYCAAHSDPWEDILDDRQLLPGTG